MARRAAAASGVQTGPRGGKFYYTSTGEKVYGAPPTKGDYEIHHPGGKVELVKAGSARHQQEAAGGGAKAGPVGRTPGAGPRGAAPKPPAPPPPHSPPGGAGGKMEKPKSPIHPDNLAKLPPKQAEALVRATEKKARAAGSKEPSSLANPERTAPRPKSAADIVRGLKKSSRGKEPLPTIPIGAPIPADRAIKVSPRKTPVAVAPRNTAAKTKRRNRMKN